MNATNKSTTPKKPRKVNAKKGRLIIRNLPFSATEDLLKDHFAKYGELVETNILKKPNGKLVGCAFIQFSRKQSAAKAIHYTSGKEFLGRPIIVDWAVPKKTFTGENLQKNEIKAEPCEGSTNGDFDYDRGSEQEDKYHDEKLNQVRDSPHGNCDENSSDESDNRSDCSSDNEDDSNDIQPATKNAKIHPTSSHDVQEGRTVFLKNVPFSVRDEELKTFMEQFGEVLYALVCVDPLTEHSKGTAFVKFKRPEEANKCLSAGDNLTIKDTVLIALPALEKNQVLKLHKDKHPDKKKDNRNLYLTKEGVILANSAAAKDVSASDMQKRLELEMWKSNMLRNLNMFVSKTRLIIHNLPSTYDDNHLRNLFKKYSSSNAKIYESKVMRNMRQFDDNGKPISKGYGFVSFRQHEDALAALRAINNNPQIFNKSKRPIVAFSIENKAILLARLKRMEKSRLNNPFCPESKKPKVIPNKTPKFDEKLFKYRKTLEPTSEYSGIAAKPGVVKLRTKYNLKSQAEMHSKMLQENKRKESKKKKWQENRQDKVKQPKIKSLKSKNKKKSEDVGFNQLVNKYKSRIVVSKNDQDSAKKWYET